MGDEGLDVSMSKPKLLSLWSESTDNVDGDLERSFLTRAGGLHCVYI